MRTNVIQRQAVCLIVLAVTLAAAWMRGTPVRDERMPVLPTLPDTVGEWHGADVLYCHRDSCRRVLTTPAPLPTVCPSCQGPLLTMAPAEHLLLPADATVRHKRYFLAGSDPLFVSLIITGNERSGIHRPEWCLPGQGYRVLGSRRLAVPLPNRGSLPVTLIELESGDSSRTPSAYAYWFVSRGRVTARHLERFMMITSDSIFRGVNPRWAYLSVAGVHPPESDEHVARMSEFIAGIASRMSPTAP